MANHPQGGEKVDEDLLRKAFDNVSAMETFKCDGLCNCEVVKGMITRAALMLIATNSPAYLQPLFHIAFEAGAEYARLLQFKQLVDLKEGKE